MFVALEPAEWSGEDNLIVCFSYAATCVYPDRWGRFGPATVVRLKKDGLLIEMNVSLGQGSGGDIGKDFLVCAGNKRIF